MSARHFYRMTYESVLYVCKARYKKPAEGIGRSEKEWGKTEGASESKNILFS